jgi:hypothetical protein
MPPDPVGHKERTSDRSVPGANLRSALVTERVGALPQSRCAISTPIRSRGDHAGGTIGIGVDTRNSCPAGQLYRRERLDVLPGLPKVIAHPRQRTERCLCSDPDYLRRYREKWSE